MTQVVQDKLLEVTNASIEEATRTLIEALLLAHRIDPKLHKVLVEESPRLAQEKKDAVNRQCIALVRIYFDAHRAQLRPGLDLDIASYLAVYTVEAITKEAVRNSPQVGVEALAEELTQLIVRYLA